MRIIGPPTGNRDTIFRKMRELAPDFKAEIFTHLWDCAVGYGIDPVGIVAQSLIETNNGKFGSRCPEWFFNTCGIKVRSPENIVMLLEGLGVVGASVEHTLCHAQFPNWRTGAIAQVQHICAYAGLSLMGGVVLVDPRFTHVASALNGSAGGRRRGRCRSRWGSV